MQTRLPFDRSPDPAPTDSLRGERRPTRPAPPPVEFVRNPRARAYVIRVRPDGSVRVTIPRSGSRRAASAFLRERRSWIERVRERLRVRATRAHPWSDGTAVLFRGEPLRLAVTRSAAACVVRLADQTIPVPPGVACVREQVVAHLQDLAARELPARLEELAARHRLRPTSVTVRNQRTRWGSCSRTGRIALNWRLIQMPPHVRDYVILHELMHLRQGGHSPRFWRLVEAACPEYRDACAWLRRHGADLL